ncbi:MAG: pilus assembly protein N-terminal domain-containing protein [Candidatus Binataceae bacterium]
MLLTTAAAALLGAVVLGGGEAQSAEQRIALRLDAGETFPVRDVDPSAAPEIHFDQGRQVFMLQCPQPGRCFILATEAGSGSLRLRFTRGFSTVYDITVAAVARPGKPTEPGAMPGEAAPTAPIDITNNDAPGAEGSDRSASEAEDAGGDAASSSAPAEPNSASQPSNSGATRPAAAGAGEAQNAHAEGEVEVQPSTNYQQNPIAVPAEKSVPTTDTPNDHRLPDKTLRVVAGTLRVFDFTEPVTRVSIADSRIADVEATGPNQLIVLGREPGLTSLVVWQAGHYGEHLVRVEKGGPQQVQLNTVVAEINRTKIEQQGIDISAALSNAGVSIFGLPGMVATPYTAGTNLAASGGSGTTTALPPNGVVQSGGQLIPLLLSQHLTYGMATQNGQVLTNSFFQFLEEHDLGKVLSEPHLIAASGDQARFLSGGEIPIVVAQALTTSIVFKNYGTSVYFVPTVIDDDEIELLVKPEVSEPDYSQGVQLFGFTVPAFVTRQAETRVHMMRGQTLIIAGLTLETNQSGVDKVPYLGDVPYLGALFRHTSFNRVKTELVITVQADIIRPLSRSEHAALPTQRGPMTGEELRTRQLDEPDVSRPRFP